MPESGKRGRYHHGDLRAALIDTAIELIEERGVRAFSLAEASRRSGVTVAAPYKHFADRDDLLAAVGVRAYDVLAAAVLDEIGAHDEPVDRLAAGAGAYVRFAVEHRALFETTFAAGLDKRRHPELERAAQPVAEAFIEPALTLRDGDEAAAQELVRAIAACSHGYATLLLGEGPDAVDTAVEQAAATTRSLAR